jgi:hypothetical protein
MKIVSIFADQLFSFHYLEERDDEFERLMNLWTDTSYLHAYAKKNKVVDIAEFIDDILQDAEEIQDFLDNIKKNEQPYGFYFEPLQESERKRKILSFQKGKIKRNKLRLYAIKIEKDCFVITGGAIKMSQRMQDHTDTAHELLKLDTARAFLNQNGVFDGDSFFELLTDDL